jgi:hypothetical protein
MNKSKVKICWGTSPREDIVGNAYGYKVHMTELKAAVSEIAELDPEAPDAVYILPPEFFDFHFEGKTHWLFTMFEGTILPEIYQENIKKAEYLLVPSNWVKGVFSEFYPKERIFVVPHGVSPLFTFHNRSFPKIVPFRFLWNGAANPRKGYEEIAVIWGQLPIFRDNPEVELYVKTTGSGVVGKKKNVTFDSRDLPRSELIRLYHDSHCFVFPSRGEGFGLTLAEAMRTGLPCIATNYSGHTDFFSEYTGYPVGYKMGSAEYTAIDGKHKGQSFETQCAYPSVEEIVEQMVEIYSNYKKALQIGAWASRLISKTYTWQNSARILVDTIGGTH